MSKEKEVVLITGTSGRIGYPLAKRLAKLSFNVVGFDRKAPERSKIVAKAVKVANAEKQGEL